MSLIRKPVTDEKKSNVVEYTFKLIPYWPLFLTLVVLAVAGAWFYLKTTTPMYETTAKILIKDDKKGPENSKTFEALDIISPKRTVDNEIEVIQSKDLIYNVVKDLSLYAPVYEEHSLRDELAYNTSPIVVSTNDLSTLKRTKKIYFQVKGTEVVLNNKARYPLNRLVATPYGNLKFSKNPHLTDAPETNVFYFTLLAPKKVTSSLSSRLKVSSANKLSTIVDLELNDENQDRGEDILNDVVKEYNRSIIEEKNQLAANTDKFINDRLTTVENNLLAIEHKQQSVKSNKGAVDIGTQGKLYLENVSTNDQKVSQINMQLSVLKQVESYVRSNNLSTGVVPSTLGVEDAGLTQMVKNIYELQLEEESLKKTTGENNPMVVTLRDKIEKIKPQILENLQSQRQSLMASKGDLNTTNQNYSSVLSSIPATEKNLVDINRELDIQSGIYTFLLQKKEETALSFISNGEASKVVEKAESSEFPVSPKNKIIYLIAVFAALMLGVSFTMTKESVRPHIMYQTEIEKLTQVPVISEIAAGESNSPIVIGNNQRTLIAEQFRRLRTTLSYLGIGGAKKRIMVTSAISGEGKSFVALNLAVSLALTGKKVVLLDFDLNKPTLHNKLQVKKDIGITDYLEGKATVDAIIKPTDVNENLHFISAGNLAQNPSELITNGAPEDLLANIDDLYDYVIIDVAPVGPISDAYILSPLCDATLYIVRHAFTPKAFVERIDKNNVLNKLNNAAIVFNDVSVRNFGNYGYGYGYGYVYGNDAQK